MKLGACLLQELKLLRYYISNKALCPGLEQVKLITNLPNLTNKKELYTTSN